MDQLIAQSYGMYEKNELTHYMITHGTGIIDVVCASQNPLVHWVNNLGSAAGSGKIREG